MKSIIAFLPICLLLLGSCNAPSSEVAGETPLSDDGTSQYWEAAQKPFYHGVASGDPLAERVIIWTRVTPEHVREIPVSWQVATDPRLQNVVQSGETTTGPERDYTVKVDVGGLQPDTRYYYRFTALDAASPVGRTKTAPAGAADSLRLAIVSCSNFEAGYFNAFGRIAALDELDAVLHLGDYIYEYEPGRYGDTTLGRLHLPAKEIVELSDYRTRYSLYRLDPDFQRAHLMHPFITIWDDHEISNNAYREGAENHQPETEGDYQLRKSAARQAYYEWLPVRERDGQALYRRIPYGELADLIMLDERLAGRSAQADSITQPDYASAGRSMLGDEQLAWFREQLQQSTATWKIIGNQVIFSDLDMSFRRPNSPRNLDAWDGYPAEKQQIISFLQENDTDNVIFVTGDTHSSWAFEVPVSIEAYRQNPSSVVAVEFGTTSVSSSNYDEGAPVDTVLAVERAMADPRHNPHLKYVNLRDHGYLLLSLSPAEARAEWRYTDDLRTRNEQERIGEVVRVKAGQEELVQ